MESCVSPSAPRYHATLRSRSETGKPTWWIRDGCIQPPSRSADAGLKYKHDRLRECAGMSLDGVLGPAWERALNPDVEALVSEFIGSGGC